MIAKDGFFPRLAWVGSHEEGVPAFMELIETGVPPVCVVTLEQKARLKRSGSVDYSSICEKYDIPCLEVSHVNTVDVARWLNGYSPDLLVVLGWGQILNHDLLSIAKLGAIGAHASLLPEMRGSAPVNWAIIRGLQHTGNTLIRLSEHVDGGDILAQRKIVIEQRDTCATVYKKVAETNKVMLLDVLDEVRRTGRLEGISQENFAEGLLPRRRPEDGLIDWYATAAEVYDFIRALTRPYPGAFSWLEGTRYLIWDASLLPADLSVDTKPGEIVGHMVGPQASGVVVACGSGTLLLTELEDEQQRVYSGASVDQFPKKGRFASDR